MLVRRLLPAALAALLLACDQPKPMAIDPDPTKNQYAPALNVQLDSMTLARSGLYVRDVAVGAGQEATAGQRVRVHYTGWLPDGTKFDSSRDRNEPFEFTLAGREVIQGWDEGVAGMKVGGRRTLVIPPHLGYGARGIGPIPPNAVLVFDVELLGVGR